MLDFRVNTFLTVCEYMNFTKAAERMCITQPAVSQHIHYLEKIYSTKFFEYEGKKIKLTDSGEIFYKAAVTMRHDETYLKEIISQNKQGKRKLFFGATLTIGEFIIPYKLHRYIEKMPDVEIEMIVANTRELIHKLEQRKIDFAFVEGYFNKSDYDYIVYSDNSFVCVAGNNYPVSDNVEKIEDLMKDTLIVREKGSGTREILEKNLEQKNFSINDFNKVMEIGNMNAIKYFTEENDGITFLYEAAVKNELGKGLLRKIKVRDFEIYHKFYFIWRKNSIFEEVYRQLADEFIN